MKRLRKTPLSLVCGLVALLSGCASGLELRSNPAGAEVFALSGEKLGETPLRIQGEVESKAAQNGRLSVVLRSPGFQNKELALDLSGSGYHEVTMSKLDEEYFSRQMLKDFSKQSNSMIRSLLQIQGLLILRKFDEAQAALVEFEKKNPNVAAAYVMMANIASYHGDAQKARSYLLRAASIDPDDPVVARMLGGRTPASSQKGGDQP